jgi:ribosomal protein S18 acetylase RimI-like enzyme
LNQHGSFQLRAPTLADVDELALVHVTCWREAYTGLMDAKFLATLSIEKRATNWRNSMSDPEVFSCVATDKDVIIGFVSSGPARATVVKHADGEIYAIYLLQKYHHLGVGKQLFNLAVDDWKSRNGRALGLLVLDHNSSAISFYERQRMREILRVDCEIGGQKLKERLYFLDFGGAADRSLPAEVITKLA